MTDHYDQDKILGYVEGELADDQRAEFEAVLADDHELRQLVSQMKLDRQALRDMGTSRAPVGLIDQVIQSHERSALLGDPAAPEPLPMTMPASRWTFRRAAAYGAIAAVLILSFGLVFQTLIPPGPLNQGTQYAQHSDATDTADSPVPDVGDGVALLDEDSAYDAAGARSLGRKLAKESGDAPAPSTAMAEAGVRAVEAESLAEAESQSVDQVVEPVGLGDQAEDPVLNKDLLAVGRDDKALDEAVTDEGPVVAGALADADTATREQPAAKSALAYQDTTDDALARAQTPNETDANRFNKEVLADAFAGYELDPAQTPTQLVVNSPSPTQARRDVRDWALANSVRLVEEPTETIASVDRSVGRAGGAGGFLDGLANFGGGKRDKQGNEQFGDALTSGGDRSLRQRSDTPTETRASEADASSYYVLVERDQVPSLLTYMNRTQGQRAELVAEPDTASFAGTGYTEDRARSAGGYHQTQPDPTPGVVADAGAVTLTDRTENEPEAEDKAEAPKAVANRLVDTETGWFHKPDATKASDASGVPLVRGLAAAPSDDTARRREVQLRSAEQDEQPSEQAADAEGEYVRSKRGARRTGLDRDDRPPTYFDWSRLLEPRKQSAPLASELEADEADDEPNKMKEGLTTDPADDSTPDTKLRIRVIIQQTADEQDESKSVQDE